ncbi:MAG: alpha/beta fold hydrolase [Gemmatimonadaceae bacterium]
MPTITLGDLETFYVRVGRGEPVLLVHGLGSSTEDWAPQLAALEGTFTAVAYDVRGHGRTAKPAGKYTISRFAGDAAKLIDRLGLGPVHVIGLSMGGMIAFQLAVNHPELVRSLVIVNSGPEMVPRTWREKLAIAQRRFIIRMMGMRKMGEVLAARLLPSPEHAAQRGTFVERWARNDKRAYMRSLNALVGWSVMDSLPSIACPVLVVSADQDYTPVALKQAYTSRMPNASLVVIPESRHVLPLERPEAFNEAVLRFLETVRIQ